MDYFCGDIQLFPFGSNNIPRDFVVCAGQLLTINDYQVLYSLISTTYGGDGVTTFCVPNLIGTEPMPNMKYYICVEGIYPTRS